MKPRALPAMSEGHVRLDALATVLKHGLLPAGFEWDYTVVLNDCGTRGCAIGVTTIMWPETDIRVGAGGEFDLTKVSAFFGVPRLQAISFFVTANLPRHIFMAEVTSADVADDISVYLKSQYPAYQGA